MSSGIRVPKNDRKWTRIETHWNNKPETGSWNILEHFYCPTAGPISQSLGTLFKTSSVEGWDTDIIWRPTCLEMILRKCNLQTWPEPTVFCSTSHLSQPWFSGLALSLSLSLPPSLPPSPYVYSIYIYIIQYTYIYSIYIQYIYIYTVYIYIYIRHIYIYTYLVHTHPKSHPQAVASLIWTAGGAKQNQ